MPNYTPSKNDIDILRELGKAYMEVASLPVQQETAAMYRGITGLNPIRPVVLIDELPWHELNFDGSLTLMCENAFARGIEEFMRRTLFKWRNCRADMYVEPFIPIFKTTHFSSNGVDVVENKLSQDDGNNIVAHEYADQFDTDESIEKLHNVTITYDREDAMAQFSAAQDIFEGIAPVRLVGHNSYISVWDNIATYRGVTPLLMDLAMRPEFMHDLVGKLMDIEVDKIRQFEEQNLYEPFPSLTHCTVAMTYALPQSDFDPEHVRAKDIWGRGMAQIFAHVSRDMHDEFDIQYMKNVLGRFGQVYYGCCEPLHHKIDLLEQIDNLRKISITPWADVDIAAEVIGNRYVLASKPNPAFVATTFDAEVVKNEITHVLDACKRNNTTCEFVLKDISSVGGRAQNLFEWEKCAMDVVRNY